MDKPGQFYFCLGAQVQLLGTYRCHYVIRYPGLAKYLIRITHKAESRSGEIQFEGVAEHRAAYQQNAAAAITTVTAQVAPVSAVTNASFMDLPTLRDTDVGPGFYIALAGAADPWAGGGVLQSLDSGGSYNPYEASSVPSTMGTLTTVLGDGITDAKDTVNSFTLKLDRGELSTTTDTGIANGVNMAAIRTASGWEVMQFQQAILQPLVAPETQHSYIVSGLYRGKFGTEWATAGHAIGDRFVLLDSTTIQHVPLSTALIDAALYYKVYTLGQSVGSATIAIVTNHGVALKPYSVVNVITSGLPGDLTISWTRRYRVAETVQPTTYEVEIWDSSFTTLKHTFTGVPNPTVVYPAAQIAIDFGAVHSSIGYKIFQISTVVGRGYETKGTVDYPPPALSGQAATTATGTATPSKGPTLTGQSITVSKGNVT